MLLSNKWWQLLPNSNRSVLLIHYRAASCAGLQGCISPGMPASQLAYAPPSIVRQALQHQSPPVRLPSYAPEKLPVTSLPIPQMNTGWSIFRVRSSCLIHTSTPLQVMAQRTAITLSNTPKMSAGGHKYPWRLVLHWLLQWRDQRLAIASQKPHHGSTTLQTCNTTWLQHNCIWLLQHWMFLLPKILVRDV